MRFVFQKQKHESINAHTRFTFGKYQGQTLQAIWINNPRYIQWCLSNLDHFTMAEGTYEGLCTINDYSLDSLALSKIIPSVAFEPEGGYDYEQGGSYEDYAGSYAQDVEGYSDEDIEDIFDGDPEMYWNID